MPLNSTKKPREALYGEKYQSYIVKNLPITWPDYERTCVSSDLWSSIFYRPTPQTPCHSHFFFGYFCKYSGKLRQSNYFLKIYTNSTTIYYLSFLLSLDIIQFMSWQPYRPDYSKHLIIMNTCSMCCLSLTISLNTLKQICSTNKTQTKWLVIAGTELWQQWTFKIALLTSRKL